MSVRKRTWTNAKGEDKTAWVCDYVDGKGTRRLKSFRLKKEADGFAATAKVEVQAGTHIPDDASETVAVAGEKWIAAARRREVERGTLVQYRQHLDLHILPFVGQKLVSKLTVAAVREFEDALLDNGRSSSMARKVMVSLGSLLADAQERGKCARNPVRDKSRVKQKGQAQRQERRQRGRLRVGEDIPSPEEIKAILGALSGRWRPILITAVFTGLRASELRGLRWQDVDLDRREIHVRQRADRFNDIGAPKSEEGGRTLPLSPMVVNTLREWKLACPKGPLGLVFPNGQGRVESLSNIVKRGFMPAQVAAGVVDGEGKAKYTGLHCLRHFFASWCINRREDGGLGLPPKMVQERLGHSTIELTMNTYSHLFPRPDHADELAAAEALLLN